MTYDLPYIQCSGLNNNAKTYLRLNRITRTINKNLGNFSIPGTNNSPNADVDFVGTNNHQFQVEGYLPLRSGVDFPDGYGRLASTELDISGLGILETTGSAIFFTDEFMGISARMTGGVLLSFVNTMRVQLQSVDITRDDTYTDESYEVGYILPYRLTLLETTN